MGEKRDLNRHQKGIVRRYYDNREAISTQRLGEIVTELYLATSKKRTDQLWGWASRALEKSGLPPERYEEMLRRRNMEWLAELVQELF